MFEEENLWLQELREEAEERREQTRELIKQINKVGDTLTGSVDVSRIEQFKKELKNLVFLMREKR